MSRVRCYSGKATLDFIFGIRLSVFVWTCHSGGTAFNGVVEELKKFTTRVAHVLPVSDDGGSTAEIVRVLGLFAHSFLNNS